MICEHCGLENAGGFHSPRWCFDYAGPEVVEQVPITGGMILPREPVAHDSYRTGLCVACSVAPHSAGRPRCGPCHEALQADQPSMDPGLEPGKLGCCALPGCSNPTVPGCVICGPCRRSRQRKSA